MDTQETYSAGLRRIVAETRGFLLN